MSEIFVDTIKNKAGSTSLDSDKLPNMYSGSAKAWSNFDQFYTNTLRDSFNVSSAVDDAQGESLINLSSSMSDGSYVTVNSAATNSPLNSSNYNRVMESVAVSASQVDCITYAPNNIAIVDIIFVQMAAHGDLA